MGNTLIDLVKDLKEKQKNETDLDKKNMLQSIIVAAKRGHYHDFLSSTPTPKIHLYNFMSDFGYEDIAQKVKQGKYDNESPDDIPSDAN